MHYLSESLIEYYRSKRDSVLDEYSPRCLKRVWQAVRFSWWMTTLLHKFPENGDFGQRIQLAELDYLVKTLQKK